MTDINKIAEAPSGEKISLDGTEKVPLSGSKWALISRWISYIFATSIDTDGTLAANSDSKIPSQKSVKTYVDGAVVGLWEWKGTIDCSANPNYPSSSKKGDAYTVSVAGKIGGASGKSVDVNDVIVAYADNAGGTEASVGTSWNVFEHNLIGALLAANNLSDVANPGTARTNLGLGTAATKNVPASGNASSTEVVLGSDTRLGAGAGTDTSAIHVNEANEISTITEKTTLVADDLFIIEDSEALGVKKKVKKSNVGGSGVTPPTTVLGTDIATCIRWYDGSQMSGSESDLIASLTDFSATADHATQGTTGNKPKLRLNAFNGLNGIEFDGVDDYLTLGTNLDLTGGHTILITLTANALFNAYPAIFNWKQTGIYARVSSSMYWGLFRTGDVQCGLTPPSDTPIVIGLWAASPTDYFIVNGTSLSAFRTAGTNNAASATRIGWDGAGAQVWGGILCDLRVYSTKISRADLLASVKHLQYKWANRLV